MAAAETPEWPPWLTLTLEDLTDTTRALALYTSLCALRWLPYGAAWMDDDNRLLFLTLVEYALEVGHHPAGLLRWLILHGGMGARITSAQVATALARLQDYYIALSEVAPC
jgi:hypothetical protein